MACFRKGRDRGPLPPHPPADQNPNVFWEKVTIFTVVFFWKYSYRRLIRSRIIISAAYCNQILLVPLYLNSTQNTLVDCISWLLLSLLCWHKLILLSGGHCSIFWGSSGSCKNLLSLKSNHYNQIKLVKSLIYTIATPTSFFVNYFYLAVNKKTVSKYWLLSWGSISSIKTD